MVDNISNFPVKLRKLDDSSNSFIISRALSESESEIQNNSSGLNRFSLSSSSIKLNQSKLDNSNLPGIFYQNGQILSRFLERLKIKTIPHITPLIERLVEAENKNIGALKSIDKINRRIKELELHIERKVKKNETINVSVGADITDPNSEEYKRIMASIPSSPFAPTKLRSSQSYRNKPLPYKEDNNQISNDLNQKDTYQNGQIIDLTNEKKMLTRSNMVQSNAVQSNGVQSTFVQPIKENFFNNQQGSIFSQSSHDLPALIMSAHYLPKNNTSTVLNAPSLCWKYVKSGICLQWDMVNSGSDHQPSSFQIYSFQKSSSQVTNTFPWKNIGEVDALPLPMACTLTQVASMSHYFFAVRAVVQNQIFSPWSNVVLVETP